MVYCLWEKSPFCKIRCNPETNSHVNIFLRIYKATNRICLGSLSFTKEIDIAYLCICMIKINWKLHLHGNFIARDDFLIMTLSNWNIFRVTCSLWVGNSPVTGEFPSQRPVTRSFDVFFDLRLNKRFSKQSRDWWFERQSGSLWRQRNNTTSRCISIIMDMCIYQSVDIWLDRAPFIDIG